MGFRDSMRFKKWTEESLDLLEDQPLELDQVYHLCRMAYEAGFYDGAEAAKTYDPYWDAD